MAQSKYRVWNIINIPNNPTFYPVDTPEEGIALIDEMANEQLKDLSIESNAFGIETIEDGEWTEIEDEIREKLEQGL